MFASSQGLPEDNTGSPLTGAQASRVGTLPHGSSVPQGGAALGGAFGSTEGTERQVPWPRKENSLAAAPRADVEAAKKRPEQGGAQQSSVSSPQQSAKSPW